MDFDSEDMRTYPMDPNFTGHKFQNNPPEEFEFEMNQFNETKINQPSSNNPKDQISNIMNKFFQQHQTVQPQPQSVRDVELEQAIKISKEQSEKLNKKYEKLENDLVTRGLKIYQVSDDGNCLFRALSYQLYGTVDLYATVREKIISYMRSAREHYDNFLTEDFDSYLAKMSCDGEYGTNLEVQACVESFQRPIEVYSDEAGAEPLNIFQGNHFLQKPLRVSYHRGNHYNAVVPIESEDSVIPPTGFGKFEPKEKKHRRSHDNRNNVCLSLLQPRCNKPR